MLTLGLAACNGNSETMIRSAENLAKKSKKKSFPVPVVKSGIEGFYTGSFTATEYDENKEVIDNNITICIDSVRKEKIYGHSVVAGNNRPFKGSYKKEGKNWEVTASEPGQEKWDGSFYFVINAKEKMLKGTWKSNKKNIAVTGRSYKLEQRPFRYNPSLELPDELIGETIYDSFNADNEAESITEDALRLNASKKLLAPKDVENMYKGDLELVRNAIYARHGYSFKNLRMRTLFDNYVKWYMPVCTNVTAYLTEIEVKNIELIKRYESHADKYYDAFGR